MVYRLHICKFTDSLKSICNLKINTHVTPAVFHKHAQGGDDFELLSCASPEEVKQGDALPLCFSSDCKPESCSGLFRATFFTFCGFFLGDFAAEKDPQA